MAEIKDLSAISAKWRQVTPERSEFYKQGVLNPRRPWAASAIAAEETYIEGVKKAADEGRYGRGIKQVGDQKWQSRAANLGPGRFREGVQVAEADFMAGYEPYHQVIQATTLPPRFPKGDIRNLKRVEAMAIAQHKKRLDLLGVR